MTNIAIPQKVETIGQAAFYGCSKLTSISIPKSVTSIGSKVFVGCSRMKKLVVEEGKDHFFNYYKINDDISVVPTLNSDITSKNYFAEPIYMVMKYEWYIKKMYENLYQTKIEKKKVNKVVEIFRNMLKAKE